MNNKIAGIIKGYVEDLTWIDKISGLVQTVVVMVPNGKDSAVQKSYPVSCNITADACKKGGYQDLCPDSKKKSVLYFEDLGCVFDHQEGEHLYYKASLRLVCWLNLKLIQAESCDSGVTGCGSSGDYVLDIIKSFEYRPFSSNGLYGIMIHPPSQVIRDVSIFSKYTYSETAVQYLLFPFEYFALDFNIDFFIPCLI